MSMNIVKGLTSTLFLATIMLASCTSEDDSFSAIDNEKKSEEIVYSIDVSRYAKEISSLDSLESIDIPVNVIENCNLIKKASTRAGETTPVVGTITNLGNQKTWFKYGVGENLVPSYYCGPNLNYMTISTVYKVSVRYDLNDNYDVKGFTGEKSGWNGRYINNPQTRWQGKKGDTSYTELYTYVYDIKSTLQGASAGKHCWVPVNINDVRIYSRILQ